MPESFVALVLAALFDRLVPSIPDRLHPVAWFGALAGRVFARLPRAPATPAVVAGTLATATLVALAALVGVVLERALPTMPAALHVLARALVLASTFAARGLYDAARGVAGPLAQGDLDGARVGLRSLCSRDPSTLDGSGLAGSAVASVGENLTDSIVGPLLAYAAFGLPGALAYRAANTLDAMVGYRGALEHLGKAAARLDDLLNLVPARLSALALLGAGLVLGDDVGRAARVLARDRHLTPSPNGGHPMSTLAALLGVRLEKPGVYVLFPEGREPTHDDVEPAILRVDGAALLVFVAVASVSFAAGAR